MDPRVTEFIRLFNDQEFFEAHDVLEELWQEFSGPDRPFYQGLIQVAVALEHLRRGNTKGARGVLSSARRHLEPFLPVHRGFDVETLLRETGACVESPKPIPPPRLHPDGVA